MKALTAAQEEGLAQEIAALTDASRDELKERWQRTFGHPPPRKLADLIIRAALAYQLQESVRGGLKQEIRRRLHPDSVDALLRQPSRNRPGTLLIREWQGVRHTVTILDQGVAYQGRHYRSLTEVARLITGTHQSGPIFFGVVKRRRDE